MKIEPIGIAVLLMFAAERQAVAASCESLSTLKLSATTITRAEAVPAGGFVPPSTGRGGSAQGPEDLPAFCRVQATLKPSPSSDIKIEVWLPIANWNGKFQAVGNGGWAGTISYPAMIDALRGGYATSSTDTGHVGGTGSFSVDREKLVDFAYRSEHEMTLKAKSIVSAFYGNGPRFSYWNGCSTGGRQGLQEAQRYPTDYNGIISGATANPTALLDSWDLWVAHAVHQTTDANIPSEKFQTIHRAVLEACDALDGLKDGLLTDPTRCTFDPTVLTCKAEDDVSCLTRPQVAAAKKLMSPAINPRTGALIFPGYAPGTELGWAALTGPEPAVTATDRFKYVVFKDPNWDWRTFNFDTDVALAEKTIGPILDVAKPDLTAFAKRGGKLLLYHGWSDQQVPPQAGINYYKTLLNGETSANWVRLFMVPGMGHCRGGEGPDTFDTVGALEAWVEGGKAPTRIVASHITNGKADRTRPLCAYPELSRYKGTGNADDAANFVCSAP